jgi:hypothetical protein
MLLNSNAVPEPVTVFYQQRDLFDRQPFRKIFDSVEHYSFVLLRISGSDLWCSKYHFQPSSTRQLKYAPAKVHIFRTQMSS